MYTFHEKERGSLTLIKKGEESEHKKGKKFILEVIAFLFLLPFLENSNAFINIYQDGAGSMY